MKYHKQASVLVYTLILVLLSVMMAVLVLTIASILESNMQTQNIIRTLSANIVSKAKLSMKYSDVLNKNGSGFVDVMSCPSAVSMSGTTVASSTATTLTYSGGVIYCAGTHSGNPYRVYFSTGFTDFAYGQYLSDVVALTGKIGERPFSDSDATLMNISSYTSTSDGIDDNFNSDDYRGTSSGNTLYPGGLQDDDANARRIIYGYASSDLGFVNMFWDNKTVESTIVKNLYNTGTLNSFLGSVTNGRLFIDINKNFNLKLYRFDKTLFDSTRELRAVEKLESVAVAGGVGYLQNNASVLSLSGALTGNEYVFDFQNSDYALFVKNNSTGALLYTLRAETNTGSGVYINPVRDDLGNTIRALANDIIIDNSGRFLYDQFEVFGYEDTIYDVPPDAPTEVCSFNGTFFFGDCLYF